MHHTYTYKVTVAQLNVATTSQLTLNFATVTLNVATYAKRRNCPDAKCRNVDAKRRTWLEGLESNLNNTQQPP